MSCGKLCCSRQGTFVKEAFWFSHDQIQLVTDNPKRKRRSSFAWREELKMSKNVNESLLVSKRLTGTIAKENMSRNLVSRYLLGLPLCAHK